MDTQVVILAGGLGTRLGALAKDTPKPMVSVSGQPFLYWQLRYLKDQGARRVLLLISHLGHIVRAHFEKSPVEGLTLSYATESEPLGTGGALRNALPQLEDEFFVLNGDSFLYADLEKMHASVKTPAVVATMMNADAVPVPGNIASGDGKVTGYKKGAGQAAGYPNVDAGIYFFKREVISNGPTGRFDLELYWPDLIPKKQLGIFPVEERFFDIGTPERLKVFEEHLHDYF